MMRQSSAMSLMSMLTAVVCVGISPVDAGQQAQVMVVTETARRVILETARTLTVDRLPQALRDAEAGNVEAQLVMALAHHSGGIVDKDLAQALSWYQKAADQGHPMALSSIGLLYARGEGVAPDEAKGVTYLRQAAQLGYAQAQSHLGWAYYT